MHRRRFKRLFHSVFTKLLVIILAAGIAITLTVLVGFSIVRFHSVSHLDRNLTLYAEYLTRDLGDPPDPRRAEEIARRTGMAIRFDHPGGGWRTAAFPTALSLERAWIRQHDTGMRSGHLRRYSFVRLPAGGGELIFITPRWARSHENAGSILLAMAAGLSAILAAAYYFLRRVLRPLHALKTGVEALGDGRLGHRVPLTGHDEFRNLAEAFNTMAGRLADLLKNKEQLLLDVSHELRSPLTRLKVQLEWIEDEETRQALQSDVAEMEAMVATILEEARLRNTAAALKPEPTDMAKLIRSVVDEYQNRPPGVEAGVLDSVTVPVDRDKMRMVLRNLIENALKHTLEDGQVVSVTLTGGEGRIDIAVEDRGFGIPESALPHLFDPFFRADASRSRKTGGFGLGLSLCRAIVTAHKGTIEITSTPGHGTTVVVTLPLPLPG